MVGLLDKINPSQPETCIIPYCQDCAGAYMILLIILAMIIFYFFFLNGAFKQENIVHRDFMNLKIFDFPLLENCCSLWPLSHFFVFFILGVLFPDCAIPLITLGVLWEGFEVVAASLYKKDRQSVRKSSNIEYSTNWWAGSTKDIVMNIAGFCVGWFVAKKLGAKVCVENLNSNTLWCGAKKYCEKSKCINCNS